MTFRQKWALKDFVYTQNADGTFNILAVKDLGIRRAEIPRGVVKIDEKVFFCCDGLTDVVLPEGLITISGQSFGECVNLKAVKLPSTLERIGPYAFWRCRKLTELRIPERVCEICDAAFEDCRSIKRVEFSNGIETIGVGAFYGCISLSEVYLPDGVKDVAADAFRSYYGGPKIVSVPKNCRIDDRAFSKDCKIIVR